MASVSLAADCREARATRLPILVVDDDADGCNVMAKLLSALGYQADTACDGRTALQLIGQRRYGLAVLDYEMPGMNGVELFRRMRRTRPDLAAVFVTGYTTIDVIFPAVEAGVLRIFSKPADFQELIPVIDEQLSNCGSNVAQLGTDDC